MWREPAPGSMGRFGVCVPADGKLFLGTSTIALGPLPVALGPPGLIPSKSPTGCI